MRTGKATINGKEYLLCFSTRVLMALEERGGSSDAELQRIMEEHKVSDLFWLLERMIDAGDRYAKLEGLDNPGTISGDDLIDLVGVDEYETMFTSIAGAVKAGNTPEVKVKTKNAETPAE